MHAGEGWRLRVDPNRQPFSALVGGADWAAELTLAELAWLQRGVATLVAQLEATAPLLMPEEDVKLEYACGGLWLQLSGQPQRWSLRFVLESEPAQQPSARGLEGAWSAQASQALAAVLQSLVLPAEIIVPA